LLVGVALLPRSRRAAIRLLRASVLAFILVLEVFAFYESQLGALVGLALDCVMLGAPNVLVAASEAAATAERPRRNRRPRIVVETDAGMTPSERRSLRTP
jgi:hypothetical protein